MQTTIPLYGFGGGSGGIGATLTVTAPAGCTVTVSKDGKAKTKVADSSGLAVFKGLSTGEWTVTITDGSQTSTKPVVITADYSTVIAFFSATIHVTYPAGSTCTATDGVTTMTAPDTSGTWDCVVPNAAVWTVSCTDGSHTASKTVSITAEGQSESVKLTYKILWFSDGVLNGECESINQETSVVVADGLLKLTAYRIDYGALVTHFTIPVPATVNSIKLKCKYTQTSTSDYQVFYVSTKNTWPDSLNSKAAQVAMTPSSNYVDYTLDLSGINEDVYIWFAINVNNSAAELLISELVEV